METYEIISNIDVSIPEDADRIISNIDNVRSSSKINIELDNYFNNPIMSKIKDVNGYSMYACKLYCLLNRSCRYIIVFINSDRNNIGYKKKLIDMDWVSFQTRTMTDNHEIDVHSYQPRRIPSLMAEIYRVNKQEKHSVYKCKTYPISITLLNSDNSTEYQDKGTLLSALETFQTIISKQ